MTRLTQRPRCLLLVALLCGVAGPLPAQQVKFKLIVNAANQSQGLRKDQVAVLFLNQSTKWGDGTPGAPVDQSTRSAIREVFSEQVLGKPVVAIQAYWQQRLLNKHEVPPPVKSSDGDVIGYVAKNRGGIGYVAEDAELPATVRPLSLSD